MSLVETLDRRWERARDTTVPLCSFEFFPPKTDMVSAGRSRRCMTASA